MNAAGIAEFRLRLAHAAGKTQQHPKIHAAGAYDAGRGGTRDGGIERGGAAHPAARSGREAPGGHLHLERHARAQAHIDHIGSAGARFDGLDVRGLIDDSLTVQQAGGELLVVARRPHGRAERRRLHSQGGVVQLKLERRLDRHPIVRLDAGIQRGAQHAHRQRAAGRRGLAGTAMRQPARCICRVHSDLRPALLKPMANDTVRRSRCVFTRYFLEGEPRCRNLLI